MQDFNFKANGKNSHHSATTPLAQGVSDKYYGPKTTLKKDQTILKWQLNNNMTKENIQG